MSDKLLWFKSRRQSTDQHTEEKLVDEIALPIIEDLSGSLDVHHVRGCRVHTHKHRLRALLEFCLAMLAIVCVVKLAWFTSFSTQHGRIGDSNHKLSADPDDPGLKSWAMTSFGSKNDTHCDKEIGHELSYVPKECSPVGTYVQIEGVNWQNNGNFQLCLFDSPGCDRDLKASYGKSGTCLDANGAVTYRVTMAGVECKSHSWTF